MNIKCIMRGELIEILSDVDTERFEGHLPYDESGTLLWVKIVNSKLQKRRIVERKFRVPPADEVLRLVAQA